VLALIANGVGFGDIAAELFISNLTVSTYVKRARRKLGARDRAHLVALAFRDRLLGFDQDGRVVATGPARRAA
jgi:DNA-binding CsgD family transcriptional regulator